MRGVCEINHRQDVLSKLKTISTKKITVNPVGMGVIVNLNFRTTFGSGAPP